MAKEDDISRASSFFSAYDELVVETEPSSPGRLELAFLISSIAAVCLDVLFFYIYSIDEEKKCFSIDEKIKNAAIIFRFLTDFILFLEIVLKIRSRRRPLDVSPRLPWMNVFIDFLALLPLPQIIMLPLFSNMRSIRYLENRWRVILLPLFQFVPRIIRIYLLCKELSRSTAPDDITRTAWVVGAFWYCFAVIRELYCWQHACKYDSRCRTSTFFCDDITGNERFVEEFCPINPPDPRIFDFGIFLDAHQSGISRVRDFPVKLIYCFAWGLRALSSFGSNLRTSSYLCENIFAALVTIVGILLVVYLIGNLQIYLQSSTSRSEEKRRMMQNKDAELNAWINDYGVQDMKNKIMQFSRERFDGNNDVNLKTLLDVFPPAFVKQIKKVLCLEILQGVQTLQHVGVDTLADIIEHMKPVVFAERSLIVMEEQPVDQLLLFMGGNGWTRSKQDQHSGLLQRGNIFGTELLEWAMGNRLDEIPLSRRTLRSLTKMEAFALMATDLERIIPSSHFRP